ncbi:MAG TPA: ribonuclease P protein component [Saprospiraceae bacterium]|nr:ribonuclease P protein component [Saprospiraceae bacterium]
MSNLSFKPEERLKHNKLIGQVFKEGTTIVGYPLRFLFITSPTDLIHPSQVAFSVPKRMFKRAVDRNLLKRRIREAYRLQKSDYYQLAENSQLYYLGIFIYVSKEILPYQDIQKAILKILSKWNKQLNTDHSAQIKD